MTARGKMHLLGTALAEQPSGVFTDLFSQCLLCGACEQVCPRDLPITDIVSKARSRFSLFYGRGGLEKVAARSVLARPALLEGLVRTGISLQRILSLPADSGLRLRLALLEQRNPKPATRNSKPETRNPEPGTRISYFSGCLARHLQPSVADSTHQLLAQCGVRAHVPAAQHCCGLASWSAGKRDQARELARKNIQAFADSTAPIITSCASCSSHLLSYPDLFDRNTPWHERACRFAERVQEFTDFFNTRLPRPKPKDEPQLRVFYHDPCHLRFTEAGRNTPRLLLKSQGVVLAEPEDGPSCCGQGGLFHLGYPKTSEAIFQTAADKALAHAPDCITTTCSGCLMQYQQGMTRRNAHPRVVHLANLLAELFTGRERNQQSR